MALSVLVEHVSKMNKQGVFLTDVSLHAEEGMVYGVIGASGSGKSSLLRLIAGVQFPSGGKVEYPAFEKHPRIGYLSDIPGILPNQTGAENLKIKMISEGSYTEEAFSKLLTFSGLGVFTDRKVKQYSVGALKRLGLVMALSGDPDILLLDEPMSGLLQQEVNDMRQMLASIRDYYKKTVIVTGRELQDFQGVCDRIGILNNGYMIKETTEREIEESLDGYILLKADPIDVVKEVLAELGIESYQSKNAYTIHVFEQLQRIDEIVEALVKREVHVYESRVVRNSFTEYFSGMTGGHHE